MSDKIRWCEIKPRVCDCKGTCSTDKKNVKKKQEFKIKE